MVYVNTESEVLKGVGGQILLAIKRRNLRRKDVAEKAGISLTTLRGVIRGNIGTSIGVYLSILQALGLEEGLLEIANPIKDEVGIATSKRFLPKRVSNPKSKYDF